MMTIRVIANLQSKLKQSHEIAAPAARYDKLNVILNEMKGSQIRCFACAQHDKKVSIQ